MKPTLYATLGLPGSGKSTWAREMVDLRNADDIRCLQTCKDDIRELLHEGVWSKENEKQVVQYQNDLIAMGLENGWDVYVHDTNFNQKERLNKLAKDYVANIVWVDFTQIPISECIERDSKRTGKAKVGKEVILRMAKQAEII